jgi:hypothetical protein
MMLMVARPISRSGERFAFAVPAFTAAVAI